MDSRPVELSMRFEVSKLDEEQRIVFGFAQVAIGKGETSPFEDHQGDVVDPEDLAKAAYDFVLESREGNLMHVGEPVATLVESMAFTQEKLEKFATKLDDSGTAFVDQQALKVLRDCIPLGWWIGEKIAEGAVDPASGDDLFQAVKRGDYPMFSVEGTGMREPIGG